MPPTPPLTTPDAVATDRLDEATCVEAALLSAILDTVTALVIVCHPDGRIARCNRACEPVLGGPADQVAGRRLIDIAPASEDVSRFQRQLATVGATGQDVTCETSWPTRAGLRRISWSASALARATGDVAYIVAAGTDVTERLRLQRTVLDIADREQGRIGRDLHDGLGQHLTGIAFLGKALEAKLHEHGVAEAADAARIVALVNEAVETTRDLARGLLPVKSADQGLAPALRQIAHDAQAMFGISCWTATGVPVPLDEGAVTHLCYIAREAVHNAVRHGHARHIRIALSSDLTGARLSIQDDGDGFPATPAGDGLGLHLMRFRLGLIGGSLEIERGRPSGTVITCRFPLSETALMPVDR